MKPLKKLKKIEQAKPRTEKTKEEIRDERRHQRKKNKQKRIIKSLISIVIIGGIIGGIGYAFYEAMQQGFFNITEIEVTGNEIVDSESVIKASEITIGESIFLVDLNKANYKINELLSLEKLEITKIMPNKILIRMKESTPICAINYNGTVSYITQDSKLIENGEYLRKTDVPVIFGCEKVIIDDIGKVIKVEPEWRFDTVTTILKDLKDYENLDKISEIRMTVDNTYEIVTKNGTIFIVWDYNNYEENKKYIQSSLDKNISNMIVNLTIGTKPVIKPR
jgi:cell division protein FtsQ